MSTGNLSLQNSTNVRFIYPPFIPPVETWQLADGTLIRLSPIQAEEAELLQDFIRTLSVESRIKRFFSALRELTPTLLKRATQVDFRQHLGLLAKTVVNGEVRVIGWVEYGIEAEGEQCEVGLVVADAWQGRGIGRQLMEKVIACATAAGFILMTGSVLATNEAMLALARRLGFTVQASAADATIRELSLLLNAPAAAGQRRQALSHDYPESQVASSQGSTDMDAPYRSRHRGANVGVS